MSTTALRRVGALAGAVAAFVAAVCAAPPVTLPVSSSTPVADGTSIDHAAASCWEIRKNDPSAPSGTYWLWTPTMMAPEQFHCDMDFRGGGWVLVGRGREDWRTTYNGFGDPADLLAPRTGFDTTQLPAQTVDGLLDGHRVSGLRDGIRVLRAMDAQGQRWQDVRFTFPDRGRWVWTFGAGHRVGAYSFTDGGRTVRGQGGHDNKFGLDDRYHEVVTTAPKKQSYQRGFAYGSAVTAGPDAPDSYLWAATDGGGYARPYAEMYIRPRLLSSDFQDIPSRGTPQVTLRDMVSTWAAPTEWGVTGLGPISDPEEEGHDEVQALAEGEGRVFVGGNFTTVQRGKDATGADLVQDHPFLAAFDLDTGDFIPEFNPQLDGEVKSLTVLPDGRLAVGGGFTEVDGKPATGIAVVDPTTGARDSGFHLSLGAPQSGALEVRDLEVVGSQLYASGDFTSARGASGPSVHVGNAVRVDDTTGEPDPGWTPLFDSSVNDTTPSSDGARLYVAGYFSQTNGTPTRRVAVVSTDPGARLLSAGWDPVWSQPDRDYQRAIAVGGRRIWVGGSQHSLFSFDTKTYARKTTSITAHQGGDLQTVSLAPGTVYGGCHCSEFAYQGADTFGRHITGWSEADAISWVGAWSRDGRYIPEFSPMMRSAEGAGVWATLVDSNGALWAGGDLRSVQTGPDTAQWLGSFVRFPLQDHVAPLTPTSLVAADQGGGAIRLTWAPSDDDSGASPTYEVLRDDRVVAVTDSTSVDVPGTTADRFFVRAVDPTGNRSASTRAVTAG